MKGIEFVSSPVFDLLGSMFRLNIHETMDNEKASQPADLSQWVNETKLKLNDELNKELSVFFHEESFIGMSMVGYAYRNNAYESVDQFITFLQKQSADEIFYNFLQTGYLKEEIKDIQNQEEVLNFIKDSLLPEQEKWKLTYLYVDRERTKERFVSLVQQCNYLYFQKEWPKVKEAHDQSYEDLIENYHLTSIDDLANIFQILPKGKQIKEEYPQFQMVLAPSMFYGYSSLTSISNDHELFLYMYGIHQPEFYARQNIQKEDITESFKLLSDERRIQIIQLLNRTPSYGYELAQKLGLSNSTISHHITSLVNIGIVNTVRQDKRIYYKVDKERLELLLDAMKKKLLE